MPFKRSLIFKFWIFVIAALALPHPSFGEVHWQGSAVGSHGMVVTAQHEASEVGAEILKKGGNAMDAAVAVAYALAVVHPCCGNIGGGGFALIHRANGKNYFLNFREKAPLAATQGMYLDASGNVVPDLSVNGYKAVGVPGTVLGLETLRKRFGTMTRAQLMAPAIRLAKNGYVLSPGDVEFFGEENEDLVKQPNVASIFLKDGKPKNPGQKLVQPDLARTLELIQSDGPSAFYRGPIARALVAASRANGGLLSLRDLAQYTIAFNQPVHCEYRGYQIISAPPPSSGGVTVCEILNILKGYPLAQLGFHSAKSVHLIVEAERHAFLDRNFSLGDPAFVHNPIQALLSSSHAAAIRKQILPDKATPSSELHTGSPLQEGTNTTHFSIIDKMGNAVSITYTINDYFGAKVIAGNTGFFLNDEMDDFTSKPGTPNMFGLVQGENNAIAGGKRPLSSMSPTIVLKKGKVAMVVGSPGGSRIITTTLQVLLNVMDYGMSIKDAVDAPRFHHQWLPDEIDIEKGALSSSVQKELTKMGYKIVEQPHWSAAECIDVKRLPHGAGCLFYGANDKRRPAGAAVGW